MKVHLRKWLLKKICKSLSPTLFFILGSMSKKVLRALPYAWHTQYTISRVYAYDENYLLLVSSCYYFLLIEQVQNSWFKWKFNNDCKKISKQKPELNRVESQSWGAGGFHTYNRAEPSEKDKQCSSFLSRTQPMKSQGLFSLQCLSKLKTKTKTHNMRLISQILFGTKLRL